MRRQAIAAVLARDDLASGERPVALSLASFADRENRAWPGAPAAAARAGLRWSRDLEAELPWMAAWLAHARLRCRSNSIVSWLVTFTKPPTLGAVMLNSPQGKVSDPTASIAEWESLISSETVNRLEVP